MPLIALITSIFIGWVIKPKWIVDEMQLNGETFGRENMYIVMVKYITPVIMAVLFAQSTGFTNIMLNMFK